MRVQTIQYFTMTETEFEHNLFDFSSRVASECYTEINNWSEGPKEV